MAPSIAQPGISYRSNVSLYDERNPKDPMALARRIQFQIVEFWHAVVGPEWGSDGRLEGDYLHHVNLVVHGTARLKWKGQWFSLRPGFAYWFPANTPTARDCPDLYETYYLKFRCEWFTGVDFLVDWPGRKLLELGPWNPAEWIHDWTEPLGLNACIRLQAQLAHWMTAAIPDLEDLVGRHVEGRARFKPALSLMEQSLNANLRMSEVAAAQGTTVHAFSVAFRRSFGLSPKAYFNRKLNQEILRWITDTNTPAKDVGEHFGFSDEYYFNRFFTKMNGIPPLRFRKRELARRAPLSKAASS